MGPTVVFLGPSLDKATARAILPAALFLTPVQCGDLLRVVRLHPSAIVIIDGLFEQRPAVWHKEIAYVLEHRIPVIGAASMGALRAAEMAPFGMVGVGTVFEQFRDGILIDDDEVAVVHQPDGQVLTDAMVNVRATVAQAIRTNIVSEKTAERFLAEAKAVFYAERDMRELLRASNDTELEALAAFIDEHGLVDVKRQDAILALELSARCAASGWPAVPALSTPRTTHLNGVLRMASCSPFHSPAPALPDRERVLLAARYLGNSYAQVKELALLRAALSDLARCDGLDSLDVLEASLLEATPAHDAIARMRWLVQIDLSRYELYVRAHFREPDASAEAVRLLAKAWRMVDLANKIDVDADALKHWAKSYRLRHGLLTPPDMDAFYSKWNLDARQWIEMVRVAILTERAGHDLHLTAFRSPAIDERTHWLEEALRDTGHYQTAEAILADPRNAIMPRSPLEALQRDFAFGADRAAAELRELRVV